MADVGDDWGVEEEAPAAPPPAKAAQPSPKASQEPSSLDAAASESSKPAPAKQKVVVQGRLEGNCIHCGVAMGAFLGTKTPEGPIHNDCIPAYKRMHVERCAHCDCVLRETRSILGGKKLHPECVADFKAKKKFVPPRKEGTLQKFAVGRSFFGSKNWKERYFVLSQETQMSYYENQETYQQGKAPKGKVDLTAYTTRLITRPSKQVHNEALNPSTEFILVFSEKGKEFMLLVAAKTWQEHDEWTRALESYIKVVDDPKDTKE